MCMPFLGMVASFRALNFNSSNFELKSGQKYGHSNPKNVLKSDFLFEASSVGEGKIGWTVGLLCTPILNLVAKLDIQFSQFAQHGLCPNQIQTWGDVNWNTRHLLACVKCSESKCLIFIYYIWWCPHQPLRTILITNCFQPTNHYRNMLYILQLAFIKILGILQCRHNKYKR